MRVGATQQSPTAKAKILINVDGDVFTIAEIRSVIADEQIYGGKYIVEIDNSNNAYTDKDLKGKSVTFYFGFDDELGSYLPNLWVGKQEHISREGKLLLRLTCYDEWGKLSIVNADTGGEYWNYFGQTEAEAEEALKQLKMPDGSDIPQDLIDDIKAQHGKTAYQILQSLVSRATGKSVLLEDDDGIINTIKPQVSYRNVRDGVRQALDATKCFLLFKEVAGVGKFCVIQPETHGVVYSYNVANLFFNNTQDASPTIPNKIVFYGYLGTGSAYVQGSASDDESVARLGEILEHNHANRQQITQLKTIAECEARAAARLAKIQLQRAQGSLVAPMHCSQELFDKIEIIDDRYTPAKTITGYIHRIVREYDRGIYRITLFLGGVAAGETPDEGEPVAVKGVSVIPPIPSVAPWTIPLAIQGYHHDITFTADDYNDVSWSSGTIKFYDGTEQEIDSGDYHIPGSAVRYIYFDLDDASPDELKVTDNYLNVLSLKTGVVCMIQRGSDSDIKATVIPSYGKEPLLTADVILLAGLTGEDLNGAMTEISAGRIALTINQNLDDQGMSIISDGDEKVKIDDDGVTLRGKHLLFKGTSGGLRAAIGVLSSVLYIETVRDNDYIWLSAPGSGGYIVLEADNITLKGGIADDLYPNMHEQHNNGYLDAAWAQLVAEFVYSDAGTILAYQGHDDIALLKAVKSKKNKRNEDVIDASALPSNMVMEGKDGEKFVNIAALAGLNLGIQKALLDRIEALESGLKEKNLL